MVEPIINVLGLTIVVVLGVAQCENTIIDVTLNGKLSLLFFAENYRHCKIIVTFGF